MVGLVLESRHLQGLLTQRKSGKYKISIRKSWSKVHYLVVGFVFLMLISSAYSVTTNSQAMQAKDTLDFCSYSNIATNQCMAAQNTWDNAISTAWSLAAIGLLVTAAVVIKIERKNQLLSLLKNLNN